MGIGVFMTTHEYLLFNDRKSRASMHPRHQNLPDVLFVVWLVGWGFWSHSWIFHSYRDVTITGEGFQILIYARLSWPFSSESSSACHTYCNTGNPFKIVNTQDCNPHTHCRVFGSWAVTTCFVRLRSVTAGIRTQNIPHARQTLLPSASPRRSHHISDR